MAEIRNAPLPTTAQKTSPGEPQGLGSKVHATATRVGNNIDLINLYARQKDWYKVFEVVGAISSRFLANAGSKLFGQNSVSVAELQNRLDSGIENDTLSRRDEHHLRKEIDAQKGRANQIASLSADTLNTALQLTISTFSNWWEKESLVRVYRKTLQQELGIENPSFKDLKRSENPIISNAADYYNRKAMWRIIPDFLGLVKWVPELARKIGGPESKLYKATSFLENSGFSGIDLALGGKTAYFAWYFVERQTGGHWALTRIWNKTEGVQNPKTRLVNQNVHPGELVTQEEITGLYREVAQDRNLRDFTMDDPLTGHLFLQIAQYLNHNYVPKLYQVKRPEVKHETLAGTHFSHADLVTLLGTEGVDINDSYATAIRIEVLARKGIAEYRTVNAQLRQTKRPEPAAYADYAEFGSALTQYLDQLDSIAKNTLGDQWPANYVTAKIRPGMMQAFHLDPTTGQPDHTHTQAHATPDAADAMRSQSDSYYQKLVQHTPPAGGSSQSVASILSERGTAHSHTGRVEAQQAAAPAQPGLGS